MTKKRSIEVVTNEKELFKSFLAGDVKFHLDEISECIDELEHLKDRLIENAWSSYWSVEHAVPNRWRCPSSPFETCAYHKFDDRAWDSCVFCHQPYERK